MKNNMTIDVYSVCFNEEFIIPYFARHYKQFARNIIVYDNHSTDSSVEVMKKHDIEVRVLDTGGIFSEDALVNLRNSCWKGSDADWVIVCDIDEFIYHPNFVSYINNTEYTHLYARGYEMMSETLPTTNLQIYDEIKTGYPCDEFTSYKVWPFEKSNYSKGCVFKPSEITDINFGPGSHYCSPTGNVKTNVKIPPVEHRVVYPIIEDNLKLLHYKYLSREYVIDKNLRFKDRTIEQINKHFDCWVPVCKNIIDEK